MSAAEEAPTVEAEEDVPTVEAEEALTARGAWSKGRQQLSPSMSLPQRRRVAIGGQLASVASSKSTVLCPRLIPEFLDAMTLDY